MILISNIPFIGSIIRKGGQQRLRRYLKAYRLAKATNRIHKVNAAKQALSNEACMAGGRYAKHIFGSSVERAEMVIRQYLLRGVIDHIFNKPLLSAVAHPETPIVHPLPRAWRNVLRNNGFRVAETRSAVFFFAFVLAKFFWGIGTIARFFFQSLGAILQKKSRPLFGRHALFVSLGSKNIPQPLLGDTSYDIISWYAQWDGRKQPLDSFVHTVYPAQEILVDGIPSLSTPFEIQPLASAGQLAKYCGWATQAVALALADLLRGRWWHALIVGEAAKAAVIRIRPPQELASDYLFHNAVAIYRPLWTYEAEAAGARILFYFYSTNIEFFKQETGYPEPFIGWRTSTWPNHLVWDAQQAAFMHETVNQRINTFIVGPIWFQSGTEKLPALPRRAIAVFDVQPMRDSYYSILAVDFDYYTPVTCSAFLLDIHEAAKELDAVLVHKRKRDIGHIAHYSYRNLLKKLDGDKHFLSVDPDLAAQVVIGNSAAVISMPFTSTALVGRAMGKPSVYYDPHGLVRKDDKGAHGIEIVTGRQALKTWLETVIRTEVK